MVVGRIQLSKRGINGFGSNRKRQSVGSMTKFIHMNKDPSGSI